MVNNLMENGLETSLMERVYINSPIMVNTTDNFKMVLKLEKGHFNFQMVINIQGILRTIKLMVLEYFIILMGRFIKASLITVNLMVKDNYFNQNQSQSIEHNGNKGFV